MPGHTVPERAKKRRSVKKRLIPKVKGGRKVIKRRKPRSSLGRLR